MLDRLTEGKSLEPQEIESLRKTLPELPKQKTLTEITHDVHHAWSETYGNDWEEDLFGVLEVWLRELHDQLEELEDAHSALPAGMRIADHEDFGRVVVSPGVGIDRCHEIFYLDPGMSSGTDISEVEPDSLTFIDSEPAKPAPPALPKGMRLADHEEYGRVVVSPRPDTYGLWEVAFAENKTVTGAGLSYVGADTLTFLDDEPGHPEFLKTEGDYYRAPVGTIVAGTNKLAWIKEANGDWTCSGGANSNNAMSHGESRNVLRWGWVS